MKTIIIVLLILNILSSIANLLVGNYGIALFNGGVALLLSITLGGIL